jgi:hypothetical protein
LGESPVLTKRLPLASTDGPPAPHIPALAVVVTASTPEYALMTAGVCPLAAPLVTPVATVVIQPGLLEP